MKKIKNRHKNEQGLTLIELIAVVGIMAGLGLFLMIPIANSVDKADKQQESSEVSPDFYPSETK